MESIFTKVFLYPNLPPCSLHSPLAAVSLFILMMPLVITLPPTSTLAFCFTEVLLVSSPLRVAFRIYIFFFLLLVIVGCFVIGFVAGFAAFSFSEHSKCTKGYCSVVVIETIHLIFLLVRTGKIEEDSNQHTMVQFDALARLVFFTPSSVH